jgi:hypothetical protein
MKKVSAIRKPQVAAQAAQVTAIPSALTLNDYEMTMLRHLVRSKERVIDRCKADVKAVDGDVSEYIRFILEIRKLEPSEYGISTADYKTINKVPKPDPATPPANA